MTAAKPKPSEILRIATALVAELERHDDNLYPVTDWDGVAFYGATKAQANRIALLVDDLQPRNDPSELPALVGSYLGIEVRVFAPVVAS